MAPPSARRSSSTRGTKTNAPARIAPAQQTSSDMKKKSSNPPSPLSGLSNAAAVIARDNDDANNKDDDDNDNIHNNNNHIVNAALIDSINHNHHDNDNHDDTNINNHQAQGAPRYYERVLQEQLRESLSKTRVSAQIVFDGNPERETLFVCAASTVAELVRNIRAEYGLWLGKRAAHRWSIQLYDPERPERKLNAEGFRALLHGHTGWNPARILVQIRSSK